jgi:hypothetical protein
MQEHDSFMCAEPPDLLRRFVPTSVKAVYRVGGVRVVVQTNDSTLLPALPLAQDHARDEEQNMAWTLIRDEDSHGLLEPPLLLKSGRLTVVMMGIACLMGLDHERRELIGFIGADIDLRTHQESLVPLLCQMTNEVVESDSSPRVVVSSREFADD